MALLAVLGVLAPTVAKAANLGPVVWGLRNGDIRQFDKPMIKIAAGWYHHVALRNDGVVVAWGDNPDGRAVAPAGLKGVTAVAAGVMHTVALKADGTVVAWGDEEYAKASQAAGLSGVTAIAAGSHHTLALKGDGTVVAWGYNATVPDGLSGITAIAAGGSQNLALKADGTVVAWGLSTAVPVGLSGVIALATGGAKNLALKGDGTVVSWGDSTFVPPGLTGVIAIAAGNGHAMALKSNGTVVPFSSDTVASGLSGVTAISAAATQKVALKADGSVVVWGPTLIPVNAVPTELPNLLSVAAGGMQTMGLKSDGKVTVWGGSGYVPAGLSNVMAVAAGVYHCLALKIDGTVVAWGTSYDGETTVPPGLSDVTAIAAGSGHSLALKSNGTVVAWGRVGTVPSNLAGVSAIAAGYSHSVALKGDGTVEAWGYNDQGQTTVPAGLSGVIAIAAGEAHTMALKNDGTVVVWGTNFYNQLLVPTGLNGVTAIASGEDHCVALKSDGTVVAWGKNRFTEATVPAGLGGVTAITAGYAHTVALVPVPAPTATVATTSATDITLTAGVVNGSVNPNGIVSSAWFEYGTTPNYGQTTPVQSAGSSTNASPLSASLSGLVPGTIYHYRIVAQNAGAIAYGEDGTFTTLPTPPEIEIFFGGDETAPEVTDGQMTPVIFGSVNAAGGSAICTFAVNNAGITTLNLTGSPVVMISGDAANDFAVTSPPLAAVSLNQPTTFSITFTPTAVGLREASVSISSNDDDEDPFSFAIQGTGLTPGLVAFTAAKFVVNQGAEEVELRVERSGGTSPFDVTINTDDGTPAVAPPFSAAKADVDYADIAPPFTTKSFAEGETLKTIVVPLIVKTGTALPNKRFFATLSAPANGAELGAITTATIEIRADETRKPTLSVTAPAVGAKLSLVSPYWVKGIAGDARGIDRVEIELNDADPVEAVLGAATIPTSVPYSLAIAPVAGLNTIVVTAYDLRGNSTSVTRTFTFARRYLLTLTRNNPAAGTVAMVASATAASVPSPAAVNSNPKTSQIVPGTLVKLTAAAKTGFIFHRWLGLPEGVIVVGNIATFAMPAADVPGVTAEFVTTNFAPPAGQTNVFHGLIQPGSGTPSRNSTVGYFTGTLTASSGAFTGKVLFDGVSQTFTAYFFADGSAVFAVGAARQSALTFGGRTLTLAMIGGNIVATVTQGGNTSEGSALRNRSSVSKGFYTIAFPRFDEEPAVVDSTLPMGDGFATLNVSSLGAISLAGTLADGTAVTAGSALSRADTSPLFAQLPTPGAPATTKGGSFSGSLVFDPTMPDADVAASEFLWFRPAAAGAATPLYTGGWPEGLSVNAFGALYAPATKVQASLGLNPDGAARLLFSDGKLSPGIGRTNFKILGNTVTKTSVDGSYTLTLAPTTGGFSGTFTPNWSQPVAAKPIFKGILIQKGANKGGYGFFLSNAKNDPDPESGRVRLGAP